MESKTAEIIYPAGNSGLRFKVSAMQQIDGKQFIGLMVNGKFAKRWLITEKERQLTFDSKTLIDNSEPVKYSFYYYCLLPSVIN